jgi:hypothetical protein
MMYRHSPSCYIYRSREESRIYSSEFSSSADLQYKINNFYAVV